MVPWAKSTWSLTALAVWLVCDVLFTALTFACGHGYSFAAFTFDWSSISLFEDDTSDLVLVCLLRVTLIGLLFSLAIVYATPNYQRALEEKQREARQLNRRIARGSPTAIAEHRVGINGSGDKHEPLLTSRLFPASPTSPPSPTSTVPVPRELPMFDKHAINERCSRYRIAIYIALFMLCTLTQVLIGVKMVSYNFPRATEFPFALFMALPILFINLEQHTASRLIGKLTREEGYLFKSLHPHKLYFEKSWGHGCDVCRKRIKETYRCHVCDYDLCFPIVDHQLLTSRGFLYQWEVKEWDDAYKKGALDEHGQPIGPVMVACPTQPRASSSFEAAYAMAYRPMTRLVEIAQPALELVEFRGGRTSLVNLQLTGNHSLPVRLGRSGRWEHLTASDIASSTAQHAVLLSYASEGLHPQYDVRQLSFVAHLGLQTDAQIDAFIELYGYWVGDGTWDANSVSFKPRKPKDFVYLDDLLRTLGIPLLQLGTQARRNQDTNGYKVWLDKPAGAAGEDDPNAEERDDEQPDDDDAGQSEQDDDDEDEEEEGVDDDRDEDDDDDDDDEDDEDAASTGTPGRKYAILLPTWVQYFGEQYGAKYAQRRDADSAERQRRIRLVMSRSVEPGVRRRVIQRGQGHTLTALPPPVPNAPTRRRKKAKKTATASYRPPTEDLHCIHCNHVFPAANYSWPWVQRNAKKTHEAKCLAHQEEQEAQLGTTAPAPPPHRPRPPPRPRHTSAPPAVGVPPRAPIPRLPPTPYASAPLPTPPPPPLPPSPEPDEPETTKSVKSMLWWVWHLDGRRLRLLLRGLRFADGNQAPESRALKARAEEVLALRERGEEEEAKKVEADLEARRVSGFPYTAPRLHTSSVRSRDQYQRVALLAGFSAVWRRTGGRKGDRSGYGGCLTADQWTVQLKVTMDRLEVARSIKVVRQPSPVPVWCVEVPDPHLIMVRRVTPDGRASRPIIMSNCHVCFARRNRVRGEGAIRGDKGVKEETEITSTQYLLRALKLAKPHCTLILVALVCLLVNAATQLFSPNLQGQILDDVITRVAGDPTASARFTRDIQIYIGISVATGLFGSVRSLCFSLVGSKISRDVRDQLYTSILKQDIAFFDSVTSGELTSRLARDTEAMVSPMQSVLATSLSNVLLLIGGMIMVFITSWKLSILAITSIFPIIQITRVYARFSRQINKQVWAALAESSNLATQAISNIRTVRAFGTEEFEDGLYKEATQEALDKSILDAKASSLSYTLTSYLDLGTTVLLLWYGGLVVMNREGNPDDPLTVGKLITFQLYWNMMNSAYNNLNSLINQFTKAAAAAQKVMMLSDTLPDITTKHTAKTDDSTNLQGQIDVNHLSFYYQMRPEHTVLKDVNLHIPPASTCAFVGRSGGGKSTLVHLLLRFYDAKQGSVSFDGVNIDEWNLPVLRKQMAVVQQGSDLFATSIIENITYGMQPHEWTRQEVIDAAKAANCYDFIMDMEEGFDTRVGERGQRISGGQKQRIAICRALLRKPKVLLLDEATSALDAESESQVQLAIDNLIKLTHCTVLLVAHRLSTVMNADQICVLDGGTIIERGTHEQLLEQGGLYYELVKRQLARKANLLEDGEEEEGGGTAGRGGGGKAADSIDVLIAQTARQRTMKDKDERKGERKEP